MMKQFIFALAIMLLFAGCSKKKLPDSTSNNPVFKFSGSINNSPVTYTAGIADIFMFTDYNKDEQGLTTLKGYFAPYNCTNCEPYLSFEFKDEHVTIEKGLYSDIMKFFEKGYFNSYSLDSIVTNVPIESFKFAADNNPPGTTYKWYFGDGDSSVGSSPTHTYSSGGIKNISLITRLNNLSDTITIPIDATPLSGCRTKFYTIMDTSTATVNAEGIFLSYVWNFGDGSIEEGQSATHTFMNPGLYEVTLQSSFDLCLATYKRKINLTGNNQIPVSNFYYSNYLSSETSYMPRLNTGSCIITLKLNGKEYKSYKSNPGLNQSAKNLFTVLEVNPFENNAQGQKTVQVKGSIDLTLYNTANNNDSISIKSNELVIAVAYP